MYNEPIRLTRCFVRHFNMHWIDFELIQQSEPIIHTNPNKTLCIDVDLEAGACSVEYDHEVWAGENVFGDAARFGEF